jgi:uncharacterized protein YgiB involved in biofilm formation
MKRSYWVALVGMGVGSVFFLASRGDESAELGLYRTPDECKTDGKFPAERCDAAHEASREAHEWSPPRFDSQDRCEDRHGAGACERPLPWMEAPAAFRLGGTEYKTLAECRAAVAAAEARRCGVAFAEAARRFARSAKRYETREACIAVHGEDGCVEAAEIAALAAAGGESRTTTRYTGPYWRPRWDSFLIGPWRGGAWGYNPTPVYRSRINGRLIVPNGATVAQRYGYQRVTFSGSRTARGPAASSRPSASRPSTTISRGGFGSTGSRIGSGS